MDWVTVVMSVAILVGGGLGAYRFFQNPKSYIDLFSIITSRLIPVILKRMPPEQEAEMRKCFLRGGRWDNIKKRCID